MTLITRIIETENNKGNEGFSKKCFDAVLCFLGYLLFKFFSPGKFTEANEGNQDTRGMTGASRRGGSEAEWARLVSL